uniref:Pre-mRNA-splicing regulator WTAP n=1 Tax=Oncorhynchus tshawytscha TaxID=74940 RepID=A0AAZ3SX42_ONCTS
MTEEPLPKKVSSRSNVAQATLIFLKLAFASSDYLVKTRVKSLSINTDLLFHLPIKVRLSEGDLKTLTREELCERWKQEDAYVQILETKYSELNSNDVMGLRESEEKLKQQQQEAARRENILVMRLATKEQEMQECTTQIQYLKQAQQPNVAQLRSTMVDPAVYLFFLKMKSELEENKDKLEQAQNELSAWKFTPDR